MTPGQQALLEQMLVLLSVTSENYERVMSWDGYQTEAERERDLKKINALKEKVNKTIVDYVNRLVNGDCDE